MSDKNKKIGTYSPSETFREARRATSNGMRNLNSVWDAEIDDKNHDFQLIGNDAKFHAQEALAAQRVTPMDVNVVFPKEPRAEVKTGPLHRAETPPITPMRGILAVVKINRKQ